MKKYLVLIIVVLLAAVLFIRYLEREKTPHEAPPASAQEEAEGVPLPPDARTLSLPEFSPAAYQPTSRLGGTAQQPAPETDPLSISSEPCLRETKVKDVLAGYKETWGFLQKERAKSQAEKVRSHALMESVGGPGVQDMVAKVVKYQACLSLARDKDLCGSLPTVDSEADFNMPKACGEVLYPLGLAGYSLGKSGYASCSNSFNYSLKGADQFARESEFCDIAKGGLPAISVKFCPSLPPKMRGLCQETFPRDIAGCKSAECSVSMWRVYEAVKNNSPETLPDDLRPFAAALIDKKEEHCRPLADAVVQGYCSMRSRIDRKMMELDMISKQVEMDKAIRSAREKQSAD